MPTYREKLLDPRWQRKRLEVLGRDNFSCQDCGTTKKTLHVHHCYYERGKDPWDYPAESLLTLCCDCHESETFDYTQPVSGRCEPFILDLANIGFTAGDIEGLSHCLNSGDLEKDRKSIKWVLYNILSEKTYFDDCIALLEKKYGKS